MGKLYAVIVLVIIFVSYDKWRSSQSYDQGFNQCTADNVTAVNTAVAADRKSERAKQEKVDVQAQKQYDKLASINLKLNADLDGLRKRPNRKQQTGKSKLICEGTTGESLSAADAGFLTREAARADQIRTGLEACYNYADTVTNKGPD